jgi:hypothetical protein
VIGSHNSAVLCQEKANLEASVASDCAALSNTHQHMENRKLIIKRPVGRPTIRTPEVLSVILEAVESGAPLKACCACARISCESLRQWVQDNPEVAEQLAKARERGRVTALRILQQATIKDWRAAEAFLKLAFREHYSHRAEITVENASEQKTGIIVDAAMLVRSQAGYRETLKEMHRGS